MGKKTTDLYRIVKFEHLVDLITTRTLYISRPSVWDDPYEMRMQHPAMDSVFAQCWCRRGTSDAMWRIYSPFQHGVRIRVDQDILRKQLESAKDNTPFAAFRISDVKYKPQSEIDCLHSDLATELSEKYQPKKALSSLLIKRKAFEHEYETRVLVYAPNSDERSSGIRVPVDPKALIRTVLADPRMPDATFEAFRYFLKAKLGVSIPFRKSSIYRQKAPLRFGYDDEVSDEVDPEELA